MTSCNGWNWRPDPWVFNASPCYFINKDRVIIPCDDPRAEELTGFTPEDIETLEYNIEYIKKYCTCR